MDRTTPTLEEQAWNLLKEKPPESEATILTASAVAQMAKIMETSLLRELRPAMVLHPMQMLALRDEMKMVTGSKGRRHSFGTQVIPATLPSTTSGSSTSPPANPTTGGERG